jgi:hypothetical protein
MYHPEFVREDYTENQEASNLHNQNKVEYNRKVIGIIQKYSHR